MESLEEIALELEKHAAIKGVCVFIDQEIDEDGNLFVIVNDKGIIGAVGLCKEKSDYKESIIYMFLDRSKIKYLFDEGFCSKDFYKIMGEKLFITVDKEEFFNTLLSK